MNTISILTNLSCFFSSISHNQLIPPLSTIVFCNLLDMIMLLMYFTHDKPLHFPHSCSFSWSYSSILLVINMLFHLFYSTLSSYQTMKKMTQHSPDNLFPLIDYSPFSGQSVYCWWVAASWFPPRGVPKALLTSPRFFTLPSQKIYRKTCRCDSSC